MSSFEFKNLNIIDESGEEKKANLYIDNGVISRGDNFKADEIIDLNGVYATNGWFDVGAHFRDPGDESAEDIISGMECAQKGGFTDIAIFPNTNPVIQHKSEINYIKKLSDRFISDLHAIAAISKNTKGEEFTDIMDLKVEGAISFSDGLKPLHNTDLLVKSLLYVQAFGGTIINRCSDAWLSLYGQMHEGLVSTRLGMKGIPSIAEEMMLKRDIEALKYTNGKLHISNISSKESVSIIARAKKEGLAISCDVAIANLVFTDEHLVDFDPNYKVFPPLRSDEDRKALIDGVIDGTIDCIVSSHLPCESDFKNMEFDLSEPGMNTLFAFYSMYRLIEHELPLSNFIPAVSTNPRKIFGLSKKGIKIGDQASITFFDPYGSTDWDENNNPSKSRNSPLFGKMLKGKIVGIFNNGQFLQF